MDTRFREVPGSTSNISLGTYQQILFTGSSKSYGPSIPFSADVHSTVKRCWDEVHPGPPYSHGGPLRLIEASDGSNNISSTGMFSSEDLVSPPNGVWIHTYNGAFQPIMSDLGLDWTNVSNIGLSGSFGPDFGDPSEYGAAAWNRFAPKLEFAQVGLFIAELRDFPKMLRTTAEAFHGIWKTLGGKASTLLTRRGIGNQFLNQQFGWFPFVADIKKMMNVTHKFDRYYSQIKRDNGRFIRRSGTFQSLSSTEMYTTTNFGAVDNFVYPCAWFPSSMFSGPIRGTAVKQVVSKEIIRFSGSFRYWIPSFDNDSSPLAKMRNSLQLYGAKLSPSLLWEAMPWSWLIDWWSNAGDVIENMSLELQYHLGAKYAYIMKQVDKSYQLEVSMNFAHGPSLPISSKGYIKSKRREGANPWGFDLDWGELSPRQIAILTALGLSRS
jgi:hypothetical protein